MTVGTYERTRAAPPLTDFHDCPEADQFGFLVEWAKKRQKVSYICYGQLKKGLNHICE